MKSNTSVLFLKRIFGSFLILSIFIFPGGPALADSQLFNTENLTAGLTPDERNVSGTDEITGAFNYSYPVVVPPGRNGLQPKVSLGYNNQTVSQVENIVGYGWGINIPYITRVNKSGTNNLYTDSYFSSSLSGELIHVSGNTYAPRVENGEFLTYAYDGTYWTVKDKKGTAYKFGNAASSRQDNPSDSSKVYKWMLAETRDTNNNYIKYEYYKNGGQIYPDKITYTGNGSTDGIFTIEFLRESRSDVLNSYATAFLTTTSYRISEIKVSIDSTWVRKYALTYTTGDNGSRSLLSSITESGRDESLNTTTKPATSFTYYGSTTDGWTLDTSSYSSPIEFQNGLQSMLDINGDALPDIIDSYTYGSSTVYKHAYINNGNGTWTDDSNLHAPMLFRQQESRGGNSASWDQGTRIGDVNGDFFPDILKAEDNENSKGGFDAYLNNGSSLTQDTGWNPTVTFNGDDNIHSWGTHFVDLNADGLPDIVSNVGSQINEGDTFGTEGSTLWNPPTELIGPQIQMVDLNGDNLPDLVYNAWNTSTLEYDNLTYINTGAGSWTLDSSGNWDLPYNIVDSANNYDLGARFFDVNGDNLPDLVPDYGFMTQGKNTYLNTGSGWVAASSWNVPSYGLIDFENDPISIVDINTDGTLDFFKRSGSTTNAFVNNTTTQSDLLKKVTFPEGGDTTVTYKNTPKYTDGSGNILNPDLPIPFSTVYQTVTSDGLGLSSTNTFSYEGGLYYYNTWDDRKPAGFAKVTKTDNAGNKTINYYHQGNATNSSQGEYSDHVSKIGKIYRTELTDSSGNIYEKMVNKWDKYNLGTNRDFVKLVRTTVLTYDGDSDHKDKTIEYTYDNTYGNLTQKITWGEVTGSDDGSYTDTGTDKFTEDISYVANTSNYVVGLPYQDTVVDQSSNKVRESKIYFDTLSLGTVGAGNETKAERWKTSSMYLNTQKAYNTTYGVVTSSTDERGKTTSYTLDSYYLYPITVTNPLSQATSYTYDYSAGKAKQVTDPNSFVYQTVFDGLDRVIAEKVPDLSSPYDPVTKTSYSYTDTSGAVSILKTDYLDSTNTLLTYQYFDGLNRLIQERVEAEESGNYNARDVVYNNIGLTYKESLPYTSSGSAKTTTTSNSDLLTTYSYDSMNRIASVVNAIGTTSSAYDDWKTTVTDSRSKVKYLYTDAYGNLTRVDETNSGSTYSTYYEWNGNKKLTKITDASSNIRNFTYDGLGRRLTAEDLHASADGTYGTWTYTYDDAGNMTQTVDPKSQTVNYTYNDINQLLTENYTGDTGTEVTYTYGGCTNGVGKLCGVDILSSADTDYTYNSNGAVASEVKTISSTGYTTSYTYDRQSNIAEITNPDSSKVKYTYNTAGLLEKVERKESTDGSYIEVVSNFTYGPHRKVTKQKNANSTETMYTFDATKLYRLTRLLTNNLAEIGGEEMFDLGMFTEEIPIDKAKLPKKDEKFTEQGIYRLVEKDKDGNETIEATLFSSPVNYFDETRGTWRKIDSKPKNKGMNWSVDEVPYAAKMEKELSDDPFLSFSYAKNSVDFSLINPLTPSVSGQTTEDGFKITYPNALGNGIDLELTSTANSVRKDAVIKNKEALSSQEGKEFYEIPFKITSSNEFILTTTDGEVLTDGASLTTSTGVTLEFLDGGKIYFWQPIATDAKGKSIPIEIRYEKNKDSIQLTKLLPTDWLLNTKYPVITDTVVSYDSYPSGDGEVSVTGTNWDTVHDQSTGSAQGSQTVVQASTHHYGSQRQIYRTALPFDTSGVPDDAAISAADINVYIYSVERGDDDGNDFIRVVQNTTNSATALVSEDYDQIGAINNPTAGSSNIDISDIAGGSYLSINLNSTGIGWISKTSYTKLGLREGHDAVDDETSNNQSSGIYIYTAEANNKPYIDITYTIPNQTPTAPTYLKAEGSTNPVDILDTTPEFTALYNDPNPTDTAPYYKIQVSTSSDFTTPLWDSGKTAFGTAINQGSESSQVSYGGTALALDGATYYFRIKFWDAADAEGAWSTATATFTMYDAAIGVLQDLNYTYDNNGNITQIIDASETDTSKTVAYTYDDLNRMLTATATSVASGQSTYTHTYVYNSLGDITSGPLGTYTYSGSGYYNPHALTSIGSTDYTYDNSGNLTNDETWTHTWDYKNRITQSAKTGTTVTYAYDQNGSRVREDNGTINIIIPNQYYSKEGSTHVKYIYAGSQLLATVRNTGSSATPYYIHTDHLNNSSVVTDNSDLTRELTDYFPYGDPRVHQTVSFDDRKGYLGKDYSTDTELSYLEARYLNNERGQFLSQDPVFWEIGQTQDGQKVLAFPQLQNTARTMGGSNSGFASGWSGNTRSRGNSISQAEWLADPQAQNSYAYARNNPIKYTDPDGEFYQVAAAIGLGFAGGVASQYISDVVNNYQSGVQGLNVFTQVSDGKTYTARGAQGSLIGLSALSGNPYIVGGTAAGTSVLADKWLGQQTNWTQTALDSVISGGTAGVLKTFPGVPGRLPNFGTQAFFTGKHTQQELTKEAINVMISGIKDTISAISNSIKQLQKGN